MSRSHNDSGAISSVMIDSIGQDFQVVADLRNHNMKRMIPCHIASTIRVGEKSVVVSFINVNQMRALAVLHDREALKSPSKVYAETLMTETDSEDGKYQVIAKAPDFRDDAYRGRVIR